MSEQLRGILIDPYQKSITEVFVEPYPAWKNLIEVDLICAVTVVWYEGGAMETLWIDDEGLLNEKNQGPFFSVTTHPQPLAGKGIILGTDEQGETISTKYTVEQIEHIVVWRPGVKFTGMKQIEPHEEDHPLFGKVQVFGTQAQFEPIKEDDK
jgi:hypothetical protein